MDDKQILAQVHTLVEQEHRLRSAVSDGRLGSDEEQAQLRVVEEELDQCWDLLRQRRARTEYGEDPSSTAARSTSTVEGYIQ
jgi:hypothetical protein